MTVFHAISPRVSCSALSSRGKEAAGFSSGNGHLKATTPWCARDPARRPPHRRSRRRTVNAAAAAIIIAGPTSLIIELPNGRSVLCPCVCNTTVQLHRLSLQAGRFDPQAQTSRFEVDCHGRLQAELIERGITDINISSPRTMVFEVVFNHTYKFPLYLVIQTHFSKYPCSEMDVLAVRTENHYIDEQASVVYWRRVMVCRNLLPRILRRIKSLDCEEVLLEEECWYRQQQEILEIRSRNLTWQEYAQAWEHSQLSRSQESQQWTVLSQRGGLDIRVFGRLGHLVEFFFHGLARRNGWKAIRHMEHLLEKNGQPDPLTDM